MMVIPTEDPVENGGGQPARSMAGQAVMGPARSSPRRSVAAWLLRQLGPPPPPPRSHFSRSVYSRRRVTRSRTGGGARLTVGVRQGPGYLDVKSPDRTSQPESSVAA
jgi:hypothetical protein